MNSDKIIISAVILGVVALLTMVAFNFIYAVGPMRQIYIGILALFTVAFILLFPRAALIVLGLMVYSIRWFTDTLMILPREATWLIDVFIVVLVIRTVFITFRHGLHPIPAEKVIYILLFYSVFISFANGVGNTSFLVGARVGLRYLLLFIAAFHLNISRKWLKGYIVFLFIIGVLQIPIALGQFQKIGWEIPDRITGSFGYGQTPGVGIFILTLVSYLFARMLEEGRLRASFLILIGWLTISAILGEVKFYFLFMPILLIFMVRAILLRRPAVAIGVLVTGVVLFFAVDYAIVSMNAWKTGRTPLALIKNLRFYFRREMEVADYERYERTYHYTWVIRSGIEKPRIGLIGNGVGSATESAFSTTHSRILADLIPMKLTSAGTTSVVWILLEYGLVGVALVFYLLWLIFRRGRVLISSDDPEERIYGRFLEAIT
ncbi:hypothetical protein EHM69_12830, partial [candidate division KSB1 bacterium]